MAPAVSSPPFWRRKCRKEKGSLHHRDYALPFFRAILCHAACPPGAAISGGSPVSPEKGKGARDRGFLEASRDGESVREPRSPEMEASEHGVDVRPPAACISPTFTFASPQAKATQLDRQRLVLSFYSLSLFLPKRIPIFSLFCEWLEQCAETETASVLRFFFSRMSRCQKTRHYSHSARPCFRAAGYIYWPMHAIQILEKK